MEKKDGCWMKSRFDFVTTNYKNCTKSRLGFVWKIMGISYTLNWFVEKKMDVERKVDLTLWRQIMGIVQKVD